MTPVSATHPRPSPDEVRAICSLEDPVIRNLRITECYYRLSQAMAARIGAGANWCTFATWASRQAGRTIRGEDLFQRLTAHAGERWTILHPVRSLWRMLLRHGLLSPETTLGRLVKEMHSPFDALERASAAVARGNLKVFEEIGFEFARYLDTVPPGAPRGADDMEDFLRGLRPGPAPGGQDLLRSAFALYQRQQFEPDAALRPQLVFLANLQIGLHEQTRLQPQIQEALEAVPDTADDLGERTSAVLFPITTRLWTGVRRVIASVFALFGGSYASFSREVLRRVITDSLMVLSLPRGEVLSLARHLDLPWPASLAVLTHPAALELLDRFEPRPPAPDDCGARDWADLSQRLHYIIHLFRAFHERAELFDAPFSSTQAGVMLAGRLPRGEL